MRSDWNRSMVIEKAVTRQEAAVLKAEKNGKTALITAREACQAAISRAQAAIEAAQAQAARYQALCDELSAAATAGTSKPTRRTRRKTAEETERGKE